MRACSVTQFTVSDSATLRTVAHQAPLSMGFPRQEYWRGIAMPSEVFLEPFCHPVKEVVSLSLVALKSRNIINTNF